MAKVVFKDIEWDTDGVNNPNLPDEFVVECETNGQAMIIADSDITDTLSDEYGYCINSIGSVEVYDDDGMYIDEFGVEIINKIEGKVS